MPERDGFLLVQELIDKVMDAHRTHVDFTRALNLLSEKQ